MPCDQIIKNRVEFLETSTDQQILKDGLIAKGYNVVSNGNALVITRTGRTGYYYPRTGKLSLPPNWDSDDIKCAYAEQVVNVTAERNGWQLDWRINDAGNSEALVMRRQ